MPLHPCRVIRESGMPVHDMHHRLYKQGLQKEKVNIRGLYEGGGESSREKTETQTDGDCSNIRHQKIQKNKVLLKQQGKWEPLSLILRKNESDE